MTSQIFENDELVLVWEDHYRTECELAYFKCYDGKGSRNKFVCWADGRSSLTSMGLTQRWDNCVKVCQKCGKEEC